MPASPIARTYSGGTPFWTAQCLSPCSVVLNSGHHFPTEALAQAECDRHNSEHHPADVAPLFDALMIPVTQQMQALGDAVEAGSYETTEEVLFAAAVAMVGAYVNAGGDSLAGTLAAIAENLEAGF